MQFIVSCETSSSPNLYQIEIDSTVNAKIAEHQAKLVLSNDSILNVMENAKADSLLKNSINQKLIKKDTLKH